MMVPLDKIVTEALSRRTDVLSAFAAKQVTLANLEAKQAEFKPSVFVTAAVAQSTGGVNLSAFPAIGTHAISTDLSGARRNAGLFVGVNLPLYDGGMRKTSMSKARIEVESAEIRLTRVREEAVRQIISNRNALQTSLSAYTAAQSLMLATQTTFDAALAAYRSGVGSITELTLTQTQMLQAKNAVSDTYNGTLAAAASLALSTGGIENTSKVR